MTSSAWSNCCSARHQGTHEPRATGTGAGRETTRLRQHLHAERRRHDHLRPAPGARWPIAPSCSPAARSACFASDSTPRRFCSHSEPAAGSTSPRKLHAFPFSPNVSPTCNTTPPAFDTLQAALSALEGRFQQVQHMLGALPTPGPTADSSAANTHVAVAAATPTARTERDTTLGIPDSWPLPVAGELIPHDSGTARGIDVKVDAGTMVRAAGAGIVVEIRDDSQLGKIVRLSHCDGYESIYGTAGDVRVAQGERVPAGATIALIGTPATGLPPHLHFEVRRGGVDIDPSSLMKKGPSHGDLQ